MRPTWNTTVCVQPYDSGSTIRNRHTKASYSSRCVVADSTEITVIPVILRFGSTLYSLGLPHTGRIILVSQVHSATIVVVEGLYLISILSEVLKTTTWGKSFTTTLYLGHLGTVDNVDQLTLSQ